MISVIMFNVSLALPLSHLGLLNELAGSKGDYFPLSTPWWQSLFESHRRRRWFT